MRNFKFSILILIFFSSSLNAQKTGEYLFENHCNFCHNGAVKEAPTLSSLSLLTKDAIAIALQTGAMKGQASMLSKIEIESLAAYISKNENLNNGVIKGKCNELSAIEPSDLDVVSWGMADNNSRFIEKGVAINRHSIKDLKLKWVFDFENGNTARTQPTVLGNTLFTADQQGVVYALDKNSGCIQWTFKADAEVRSSIIIGKDKNNKPDNIYFGDFKTNVYAVSLKTQKLIWKKKIEDHQIATLTGSMRFHEGELFIPVSSLEVIAAMDPNYPCCSFRGSVVALNAQSGNQKWKTFTIAKMAGKTETNNKLGPSGAPVWSSPTIDAKRNLIYIGTGENYSLPTTATSDAIMAIDISTGMIKWVRQTVEKDAWNAGCPDNVNCPDNYGPDYDFGAPPMLIERENKSDILIAGQKSGMVFGIDPENGNVLWQTKVGRGGIMGGVHWGMASDAKQIFVPINDHSVYERDKDKPTMAGLHALNIDDGKLKWSKLEKNRCPENVTWQCDSGLSAAITAVPGLVFAGALDGVIQAYDSRNGDILWEFETNREFESLSGRKSQGGSIDSSGPVIIGNQLFINSGYAKFGEKAGNVLLCFEIE